MNTAARGKHTVHPTSQQIRMKQITWNDATFVKK